jgi:hypothetical protein
MHSQARALLAAVVAMLEVGVRACAEDQLRCARHLPDTLFLLHGAVVAAMHSFERR